MIIGGVAASIHGQARATEDVDAAVLLEERNLNRFVELAAAEGLRPRISNAVEFAHRNAVLLLEHVETGISVARSESIRKPGKRKRRGPVPRATRNRGQDDPQFPKPRVNRNRLLSADLYNPESNQLPQYIHSFCVQLVFRE
jgi:hypothetical protein